jgi:hypothetical protein
MFIQMFKVISGIALIGVLFVLVTRREIIFKPTSKKQIKAPVQETLDALPEVTKKNDEVLPPVDTPTPQPTTEPVAIAAPTSVPVAKTSPVAKVSPTSVSSIPNKSQYIAMKEGQSDTDDSYRPAISPCKVTMGYKIGTFDPHFGITQAKFIEEINAASALWGNQLNKTLFTYNPNGPLTINLIYDERQARTDDVNNLALEIENSKATADSIKKTYEQEKAIYLGDGEQLTKDTDAFKARYQIYTDKVTMYNNQGGAPREEYDQMTKELEYLKQTSKTPTAAIVIGTALRRV